MSEREASEHVRRMGEGLTCYVMRARRERRVGVTDRINGSKKSLTLAKILGPLATPRSWWRGLEIK